MKNVVAVAEAVVAAVAVNVESAVNAESAESAVNAKVVSSDAAEAMMTILIIITTLVKTARRSGNFISHQNPLTMRLKYSAAESLRE